MNKVALDLGFIQIYWYTIFIFLGILSASFFIYKESKKQGLDLNFLINLIFYTIIFGIIGARCYYVIFNLDYYKMNLIEIFEIWHGGLAIHGGLIAGLLVIIFYSRKYHVNILKLLDIIVVGLILGQAIGRWGNFFNAEAYGGIVSKESLSFLPNFIVNGMYIEGAYHQPTFLYESIWNIIGFIILLCLRKMPYLKVGFLSGFYLIWYSIARFYIESLRLDSLMLGPFRIAQLVSILMLLIGVYLCFFHHRKEPKLSRLYKEEGIYHEV